MMMISVFCCSSSHGDETAKKDEHCLGELGV